MKHYWAGAERVCTAIGDGGLDRLGDFITPDAAPGQKASDYLETCRLYMETRNLPPCGEMRIVNRRRGACVPGMELPELPDAVQAAITVDASAFKEAMELYAQQVQGGEPLYFYHPDHLGSASWITDRTGQPVQHLQYLPFGEPFVNQRAPNSNYDERFTFTGKDPRKGWRTPLNNSQCGEQRDQETGYSYHGARYYDPETSGLWLSVDPLVRIFRCFGFAIRNRVL